MKLKMNLIMMNNLLKFITTLIAIKDYLCMLIIHYQAFIYTNFTALIEALIKNIFKMHFLREYLM